MGTFRVVWAILLKNNSECPRFPPFPVFGPYDILLAGQALARSLVLVTANTREFSRVPGLTLENWMI
jgi:predicted nucleic acid-binding protein